MRTTARPTTPVLSSLTRLLAVLALVLGSAVGLGSIASSSEPAPTIASDKADYAPGSTVNLTGAGWSGDTTVHISVNDTLGKTWKRDVDVPVDGNGDVSDSFVLPSTFVAEYDVLATGLQTGRTATTTFTDASADIDQCANGGVGDPPESCNDTYPLNWVNGNLNGSKSHYAEGQSIPYRIKMAGLVDNSTNNRIIFAWDVTKDSKHAIDYLTDFDRTVNDANPCTGVAGCSLASETNFAIPQDSTIPFAQIAGSFSMFGGTITGVAGGDYGFNPGADDCPAGSPDFVGTDTRCIELIFTATETNPVLAWGGHIASRQNWGAGNAAVNISGSPFHTSLVALNGSGGNQDRSLSNDAVIFPATIRIIKHTAPPSTTSFDFTAGPSPLANFSLADNDTNNDPVQTFTLDVPAEFTTYTVSENAASGYALGSIVCGVTDANGGSANTDVPNRSVSINIKEGETRTCTFTNDLQTGTLTVIKHVVTDNGGSAGAGAWSIHVKNNGAEVTSSPQNGSEVGTQYTLNAGTYVVSETGGPAGYNFDGFSGDCNASGSVTLAAGQNLTCTLTNNDIPARLKLVKVVDADDGGAAGPGDFNLSATGTSGSFSSQTDTPSFHNVTPGVVYTLSETGPAGYTGGTWICAGGTQNGSTISVPLGTDVTCTITNTDDVPQLKLVKVVNADDGGAATAASFNLTAAAAGDPLNRNFSSQTASPVFHDVVAGAVYDLSETGPPGYAASAWVCTGTGANQQGATVSVALGGSVTCTITNSDNAPQLKLVKIVDADDGGQATAADFTLSADAAGDPLGRNFTSKTATPVFHNVAAGAVYDLSETGPAGYSGGVWVCTGTGGTQSANTIAVALGGSVTCTITNTDDTPTLKLVKIVDADDGGTATAASFTLHADAAGDPLGRNFSSQTASPSFHAVVAGAVYDLSETGPAGYTGSAWVCTGTGGTQQGATITVALGGTVTCTITNTDDTPRLKLVKEVTNNDGGTATAASFQLSATGTSRSFTSQTASPAFHDVTAGVTYTLSETGPAGYSASAWVCTGTGANQQGATVSVALGGSVTCTITNTDDTPRLKLVKEVTNNDGGSATAADFTLSADADNDPLGRNFTSTTASPTFHNVAAGAVYDLSETGPAGYTGGTWTCTGTGGTQVGATISVALGSDVTCTITNTDDTPQLKLVKVVNANDGGAATAADFNLSAAAAGDPLNRNFSSQTASPAFHDVVAGAVYDLSETGPAGYSASAWVCTGTGANQQGATVSVALGGSVTCTITNSDNAPQLKLVKVVDADDGGAATASDFTLSAIANGNPLNRNFTSKTATPIFHNVAAGAVYDLSETGPAGYTGGAWVCTGTGGTQQAATISVALGGTVTCTITNTDDTPTLKLVKIVDANDGGTATAADFDLSAAAASNPLGRNFHSQTDTPSFHAVAAGAVYSLSETGPAGYTGGAWVCTGTGGTQQGATITVALGGTVTCTITNTDNTPHLKLVKVVDANDGGTATAASFELAANGSSRSFTSQTASPVFHDVTAGVTYTLSETGPAGYTASAWVCTGTGANQQGATVSVALGGYVTCTITNTDNTPTLKLVKHVFGGSATAASFNLTATAPGNPLGRNFGSQTASPTFHNVSANAVYALAETGPAGYTASAWTCDGGTQNGASIAVPLGAAVTCEITNTRDVGTITAIKYHDLNGDGSFTGDPGLPGWTLFVDLDKSGTLNGGDLSGNTDANGAVSFPGLDTTVNGATYWVCEVLQAGWVNSDPAVSVTANGRCKAVTVAKDATTTVRLGNFQRIKIQVNKTLDGLAVPAGKTFSFSIRKDASTNPGGVNGGFGTVVATGSITGPDGSITSAEWAVAGGQQYPLNPGTYQLCEAIVEGYTPSFVTGTYGVNWFSPGIQAAGGFQENENTLVCFTFTVVSGDGGADNTVEFNVDNITRGFSHTIGFWKNWTSCDGSGNQFAMLDLMINGGTRNGITYQGADDSNGNGLRDIRIGNLYIEGPNACKIAVDLLDKRPVGDPTKLADKAKASSDPVYNSVSQLVAFELNQLLNATGTGSAACQAKATDAARLMQRFLTYIDFRMTASNSTYTMPSNKTQVKQIEANLLYLANVIDDYNNNTIGGCAAPLALPYPTVAGTNPPQTWSAFLPAYSDT